MHIKLWCLECIRHLGNVFIFVILGIIRGWSYEFALNLRVYMCSFRALVLLSLGWEYSWLWRWQKAYSHYEITLEAD